MKRFSLFLLCACLLLPVSAWGDRLAISVSDQFRCDAEVPAGIPQSLPVLMATHAVIDPEKAIELLMPGKGPREDLPSGNVIVGVGDGESDYMLIEKESGRICFNSEYVNRYLLELMPERSAVSKQYLPTNLALDFMTPEEAVQMAVDLMERFGIEVQADGATVYTLEQASFAEMQDVMRESEWLANTSRKRALRYLEPLAAEHEGYCINLTPTIAGFPYMVYDNRWEVCVFISRQGIEYVETGFALSLTDVGEEKPLISLEEALEAAAMGPIHMMEEEAQCMIEWITLAHRFDVEKKALTPCWVFDYCNEGAGGMERYTFDHWTSLYGIGVDAHSGKVIDQTIY